MPKKIVANAEKVQDCPIFKSADRMTFSLTPKGERFPSWVRLRRRSEFQRVFQGGRRCVRRFLVVTAAEGPEREAPARLGLAVSRRVAKRAVVRNQIKRRLREIFRKLHAD